MTNFSFKEHTAKRNCKVCGVQFEAKYKNKKVCSAKCGKIDWEARNPDKLKAARLRNKKRYRCLKFGITQAELDFLMDKQKGRCAICYKAPDENRNLAIDHDHATGKVRGLLCFACNTGVGKFNDNPALLRTAADYLERDGEIFS